MRNYLRNSARAIALASFLGLVPGLALATDLPPDWMSADGLWGVVKTSPKTCLLVREHEETMGTAIAFDLFGDFVRVFVTIGGTKFPEGEHQVGLTLTKGSRYHGTGTVDAEASNVIEFQFNLTQSLIEELTSSNSMQFTFGGKDTVFNTVGGLPAFRKLFECQTRVGWRRD